MRTRYPILHVEIPARLKLRRGTGMWTNTEMQRVLANLRGVQASAVQTLRHDFPDLYALSVKAFEVKVPGGIVHHIRLGEYLNRMEQRARNLARRRARLGRVGGAHWQTLRAATRSLFRRGERLPTPRR